MTIKKETINLPLKDRIKLMDFSKYPNEKDITLYQRQFSTFSYLGKKNLIRRSVKNRTFVINVNQIQSHKFGRLNRKKQQLNKIMLPNELIKSRLVRFRRGKMANDYYLVQHGVLS